MADNWQPPSVGSTGWVPRGLGLGAFMGGLRKGVSRWSERKEERAAQRLAIQQWEAEQEAKREKAEYDRQQAALKAAFEREKFDWTQQKWGEEKALRERSLATGEFAAKSLAGYREWQKTLKEEDDKWQNELDKHLTKLDKLETDFAQRRADEIRQAIEAGDVGKLTEIHRQVLQNADLMREYKRKTTTKEGKPTEVIETSNDINDLQGALYYITRLMKQKYGEPIPQAERPTATRNSVEFRADRARIITLLRAGRENDALQMMQKYDLTQEEVDAMEREAGIR